MSKDNGGPALPVPATEYHGMDEGMTLRDYFAAKAMQAMISNQSIIDSDSDGAVNFAASASYKFSDAMLKAREVE
ncbi:hypothetical protein [Klebsiella aerogenes]|uniref:hypothetical protein n=1 Tax=Klebsiella aerogenes TaxID=548 RepID=UPI0037CEDBC6